MRETPISIVEKKFVLDCIEKNLRLDGRQLNEFRQFKINFGSDFGSTHVTLGETRVLAQVSCELGEPKATRPNEGLLYINVELGPMAAINFEAGRNSDLTVQINRILERTFKESRAVDLESLCVIAEEKVWILRVDLNILNYEGNIIDCASLAALCALAHFKRPDISVSEEEIKIHTSAEKDPIPIVLHHYPTCISYATFNNGEKAIADPTLIEERCAESNMIFGFNSYRELCCISLGGTTLTSTNLFLWCAHQAANRARDVVEQVKVALTQDAEMRLRGKSIGFGECLRLGRITSLAENRLALKLPNFNLSSSKTKRESLMNINKNIKEENLVESIDNNTSILKSTQANIRWVPESESSETDYSESQSEEETVENPKQHIMHQPIKKEIESTNSTQNMPIEISSDSEEEATITLG